MAECEEYFRARIPGMTVYESDIGAVVGTHAGPGCAGIAYFVKSEHCWGQAACPRRSTAQRCSRVCPRDRPLPQAELIFAAGGPIPSGQNEDSFRPFQGQVGGGREGAPRGAPFCRDLSVQHITKL